MARAKTKNTRSALTYETLSALFTGICDAIRSKTGDSGLINHQDIPATIAAIPTGTTYTQRTTATGGTGQSATPYTVTADHDGLMVVSILGNRVDKIGAVSINGESATYLQTGVGSGTSIISTTAFYVKTGDAVSLAINQTNYQYIIGVTILY